VKGSDATAKLVVKHPGANKGGRPEPLKLRFKVQPG
jgi:hypothetical protein